MQTYKQAQTRILDYLASQGWKLSDRNLKVPHATTMHLRLWFKPQAVWMSVSTSGHHELGNARSLHLKDMRTSASSAIVDHAIYLSKLMK